MANADSKTKTNIQLVNLASKLLIREALTVAVAESVTSGALQNIFSLAENATQFFQGGITAYNVGQKTKHLMVDPIHATEVNCVSQKVSDQMALEVSKHFSSDLGIAITGYATPVPELKVHQVYAHLTIAHKEKILARKKISGAGASQHDVQLNYISHVIQLVISTLKKGKL